MNVYIYTLLNIIIYILEKFLSSRHHLTPFLVLWFANGFDDELYLGGREAA